MRIISWEIKDISRVLQVLLKYFNGTAFLTSLYYPQLGFFPVKFILDLNDLEFIIAACNSSL